MGNSQWVIWCTHAKIRQEIIFLRRVWLRFRSWQKRNCTHSSQKFKSKPRAFRNATKLWGQYQWVIWYTHAKIHQEIIFLRRVWLRFRSWQKPNCTRSGQKFKSKSRACRNATKLWRKSQCII